MSEFDGFAESNGNTKITQRVFYKCQSLHDVEAGHYEVYERRKEEGWNKFFFGLMLKNLNILLNGETNESSLSPL